LAENSPKFPNNTDNFPQMHQNVPKNIDVLAEDNFKKREN
jgi:hypothetical protein